MSKKVIHVLIQLLIVALVLLAGFFVLRRHNSRTPERSSFPSTPDLHPGQVEVANGLGGTTWAPLYEELAVNSYDPAAFSPDGQYIVYNGSDYTAKRGVDVSYYQGEIDWEAVASDGVDFAILRAGFRGSTEGGLFPDELFLQNLSDAKQAGLQVGVYFFSQAISVEEAEEEARFVLDLMDRSALDLPVFFDWEYVEMEDESARTDSVGGSLITDCALAFCNVIENAGYDAGVYFFRSLGYHSYDLPRIAAYDWWVSCIGDAPDFYYDFRFWQYSYTARVNGIETETDLNLWLIPVETQNAAPEQPDTVTDTP